MKKDISADTDGAIKNMILIQNIDGLITQIESDILIQAKIEGIIHFKNNVCAAIDGPGRELGIKRSKRNEINLRWLRSWDQFSVKLDNVNGR
jgi:hypothetical protein